VVPTAVSHQMREALFEANVGLWDHGL